MKAKVKNNEAFQINGESFSVTLPDLVGGHYTLKVSTDGANFVDRTEEIAGGNLVVSGVVSGMYFKINGLGENEVEVIW